MEHLILAVVTLPMVSALLTQLLSARMGRRVSRVSIGGLTATFLCAAVLLWHAVYHPGTSEVALGTGWGLLLFDPLSALMALVVSGISLIVHLYSRRYMAEEAGYGRFFVLLDLMTAALLVMVAAGDLITLLIAWHLIGVLLYLLLGQDTRSRSAYRYAFWTLLTYRIGDLPMVLAAALLYGAYGTWSLPEIFAALSANPDAHSFLGMPLPQVVAALIALSAFARSAQFFTHTWLPYTMSGPTPVSALMHAGIVNAGGFLINRFAPVFVHSGDVLHGVFLVGLVTAVIGSVLMLTQHDIKKALGYSTMGQMGYMIMECGLGAFSLAIYHLLAHGVFKATLFLGSGSLISQARKDPNIPEGEVYKFMVTREMPRPPLSWVIFAGITITVPLIIVFGAHQVIDQGFLHHQGAIVLLLFGWITGAQTLFFVYKLGSDRPFVALAYVILAFALVIMVYVLVGSAFDALLYPDPAFREALYQAASVDFTYFVVQVLVLSLLITGGWLLVFRAAAAQQPLSRRWRNLYLNLYAFLSRELYVADLYSRIGEQLLAASRRLNAWMRWV